MLKLTFNFVVSNKWGFEGYRIIGLKGEIATEWKFYLNRDTKNLLEFFR